MRAMLAAAIVVAIVVALIAPVSAADPPQPPATFAPVADAVKGTVFSVVRPGPDTDGDDEGFDTDLFRELFEARPGVCNRSLGAAVMIEPRGVAMTSSRVLRDATAIELVAVDGRRYRATVVARDERTDIAVLQMTAPLRLPAARFGDSDEVRVGDWVLAVGSPYGFEFTAELARAFGAPFSGGARPDHRAAGVA